MKTKTLKHSPITYFDGKKSLTWDSDVGWTILSGDDANEAVTKEYFEAVPWLYRGVGLRADAVASMPFALYKGKKEWDTSQDWQNKVGFIPDPASLFWLIEASLTLTGKAYLFSDNVMNGRARQRLRYVLPDSVKPVYDEKRGNILTGFERWDGKKWVPFTFADIVYFWGHNPYTENGPGEASPAKAAMAAAGVLYNVDEFIASYFKHGAVKATIFTAEGMAPEEAKRFENWFVDKVAGIGNAFRTKVLNALKMQPVVVGEGLESLSDNNLSKDKREDIGGALGIPQTKLFSGDASGLGGGGVTEADDIKFYNETIIPQCNFIASVLNVQVFEPLGLRLRFQPETLDIFQEDEEQRSTSFGQLMTGFETASTLAIAKFGLTQLGFEMTDEMEAWLVEHFAEKEKRAAQMAVMTTNAVTDDKEDDDEEPQAEPPDNGSQKAIDADLDKWRRKSLKSLERGKGAAVEFVSDVIPEDVANVIAKGLQDALDEDAVKAVFEMVESWYDPVDPFLLIAAELRRANDLLEATSGPTL